jgi:Cdc6-like AAA superfamily ATPase
MEETSFSKLRDTLKMFSEGKAASALLIQGAWGSGKTYACRKALEEASLPYGYVSLYGMSKRDEIYSRICLGWNDPETKGTPRWCDEVIRVTSGGLQSISKFFKAEDFAASLGIAGVGQLIEGKVIVIDDLERR